MPLAILLAVSLVVALDSIPSTASYLLPVSAVMGISLGVVPSICALRQLPAGLLSPCVGIRIGA
eukprot:scaffold5449_cov52-Cyclotella_meneghiniana.AAC.1